MHLSSLQHLEYPRILEQLAECAVSPRARQHILSLSPYKTIPIATRHQQETSEALAMFTLGGNPPLAIMDTLDKILHNLRLSTLLSPDELSEIALFAATLRRMQGYLLRFSSASETLSAYGMALIPMDELEDEINRCIRSGQVDDKASPELRDVRRQIDMTHDRIKTKLDSLLRGHPEWFMESFVSQRDGHWTLPLRREHKRQIQGRVIASSGSGGTLFIEPAAIERLQEELSLLFIRQDNEEKRILYTLSNLAASYEATIRRNCEAMEHLDFLFAKAKLSAQMQGSPAQFTTGRRLVINQARHPLLDKDIAVPLTVVLDDECTPSRRAMIITGPNTGGKTVCLKTIGLLSLMAQSGLHVPCDPDSCFILWEDVLCDIGDGQSIEQNLSTFSSHIVNIQSFLDPAGPNTLVLLDELGIGTDPGEGMGLAIALLETFMAKGCMMAVTTHYPEIKDFAEKTPGFFNARMLFDIHTLKPLYALQMDEAGESCALLIALRLGLDADIVRRAHEVCYGVAAIPLQPASRLPAAEPPLPAFPSQELATSKEPITHEAPVPPVSKPGKAPKEAPKSPVTGETKAPAALPQLYAPGDSVWIPSLRRNGTVAQVADARGNYIVIVGEKRLTLSHKRIKPFLDKEDIYPDNYDVRIVTESVQSRKVRHQMDRKHVPGQALIIKPPVQPK